MVTVRRQTKRHGTFVCFETVTIFTSALQMMQDNSCEDEVDFIKIAEDISAMGDDFHVKPLTKYAFLSVPRQIQNASSCEGDILHLLLSRSASVA